MQKMAMVVGKRSGLLYLSKEFKEAQKNTNGLLFKNGPIMEMCFGFVNTILRNLEKNLNRLPDEMVNFLATVMQSPIIEANCEDPMWLFTDLLIG